MTAPAPEQPIDAAPDLESAVGQAIEACGGDPVAAVRALIVVNSALETELAEVYARASRLPARPAGEAAGVEFSNAV